MQIAIKANSVAGRIYYIDDEITFLVGCPSGQGPVRKTGYAGSNPAPTSEFKLINMLGYFGNNFEQINLSGELEKLRRDIMNNPQPICEVFKPYYDAMASFDASLKNKKPMLNSNHLINLIGEHKFLTLKVKS